MKSLSIKAVFTALSLILSFSVHTSAQTKGWGLNANGQLGIGNLVSPQPNPVTITAVPDATAMHGNYGHTLFLKADGTIVSTGSNSVGELGSGTIDTTSNRTTPAAVINLSHVTQITTGYVHSAALRDDGTVWVWGHNAYGQIGNGTFSTNACQCIPTPTQENRLSNPPPASRYCFDNRARAAPLDFGFGIADSDWKDSHPGLRPPLLTRRGAQNTNHPGTACEGV